MIEVSANLVELRIRETLKESFINCPEQVRLFYNLPDLTRAVNEAKGSKYDTSCIAFCLIWDMKKASQIERLPKQYGNRRSRVYCFTRQEILPY